jgi:hypothetical protein
MAELSDRQRDVLTRIGVALLLIQSTELAIQFCLEFPLQSGDLLTLEKLERERTDNRKRTLGQFSPN